MALAASVAASVSAVTVVKDTGARATLPPFGEEHEELRETVGRFVAKEIAPNVDEWEAARQFPRELYGRCAELGFLGLKFPEAYGGQGGTHLHDAIWVEELARSGGSGGVAAGLNAHASIAMPPIFNFGTEEQKQRWLVPGIAGEKIGALGITEPGAGSDVAGISTFAEGGHGGISFLVLEREMPGYEVARKLEKMGWHSSDTGELSFTDIEVPAENLLGEENKGFHLIMANFAWERLLMAIGAVGAMQRLIEVTVAYAHEREAFGRPIGKFQAIRHQVAEMATKAEAARALTYNSLRLFHEGHDCIKDVTMAKLITQRAVLEIADQSLQIHGGYGYMREYGIERAVRDARLGPIGGGTDEVMKEILGKLMGL